MPRKLTQEEYIAKALAVHGDKYDYSSTVYINNSSKITVLCPTHGEFSQLANDHISKKAGCPSCAGVKRMTQDEFLARSKKVHGDEYDYSEAVYKNHSTRLILTCSNGHRFEQLASSHLNGFKCPHCAGLARKTTEQFIVQAKEKFGDKFDYSKVSYVNARTPVTIVCAVKGEFQMQPIQHLMSKTGYTSEIYNEPSSTDEFLTKARSVHGDTYDYSKVIYKTNKSPIIITCKLHGDFEQLVHNHYKGGGCPTCALGRTESKPEKLLNEALAEYEPIKDRSVLAGRELDLYFEQYKLAVEVNGVYFHSDVIDKSKKSHVQKFKDCLEASIKLMQFTDAEVLRKQDIVVSMVKNAIGDNKRLFARKCEARSLSNDTQKEFFTANHISGSVNTSIAYGLFYEDQLVTAMSFGHPRFTDDAEWEILRFASLLNTTVVGGASKLFKAFINNHTPTSVLTYSDLRFGLGKVYEQLGFKFIRQTDVGYSYHHQNGVVVSRYQAQKHKLVSLLGSKFDPLKSERDNMVGAGYHKLYDCGNYVYLWNK